MAVSNNISRKAQPAQKQNNIVTYMANGAEIKLTPGMVKAYLVSGDPERVTDQELAMFINLCKYQQLNPWTKEAYLIKYGTSEATLVIGKEAFMKRAESHPEYDGMESGIIVKLENGDYEYRTGMMREPSETVVGGWAEVFRKDRTHSTRIEVSFDEYVGKKKDGSVNAQWTTKPATMIRKVAQVQALREAFPTSLGGMYTAEEQGTVEPEQNITPVMPVIDAETGESVQENAAAPVIQQDAGDSLL